MPALFESKARTRSSPAHMGEGMFAFLDESGWQACDAFRNLINGWISTYPLAHQLQIVGEMRSGDDQKFLATALELVVGAMLQGLGFETEPHPCMERTAKTPDFRLVKSDGSETLGYVEVTIIGAPDASRARGRLQTPIYHAIDQTKMPPGFVLEYDLVSSGASSPALEPIRRAVAEWVNESVGMSPIEPTRRAFVFDDWEFELTLISTGTDHVYDGAIHLLGAEAGFVETTSDIRKKLSLKSRRYGDFGVSYLIVVGDSFGKVWGTKSISTTLAESVFGDQIVRWSVELGPSSDRSLNGFWLGPAGPQNQHVSGVLFFPDLGIWGLRNDLHKPVLAINPWATHPLPDAFSTMRRIEVEGDEWALRGGLDIADLIGLPLDWPPPKEAKIEGRF